MRLCSLPSKPCRAYASASACLVLHAPPVAEQRDYPQRRRLSAVAEGTNVRRRYERKWDFVVPAAPLLDYRILRLCGRVHRSNRPLCSPAALLPDTSMSRSRSEILICRDAAFVAISSLVGVRPEPMGDLKCG